MMRTRKVGKSDVKIKSRRKLFKDVYEVTDKSGNTWIETEEK